MKLKFLPLIILSAVFVTSCVDSETTDNSNSDASQLETSVDEDTNQSTPDDSVASDSDNIEEEFSILGKHNFSLQWIEGGMGSVEFTDKGGAIMVRGKQLSEEYEGDFIEIEASLISADEKKLVMEGIIAISSHIINNGELCLREGTFTFIVTNGRKYWRLADVQNPCDEVSDYIDIFF
ncbi:MAG: hypothetical protein ACI865_003337 [Flavobacteriaceae bacterium]|jgi:hypothetical protein